MSEDFVVFPSNSKKGARPVVFKPNGSFKALVDTGKMTDPRIQTGAITAERAPESKAQVPGYTGFIRGRQHVAGRTYGALTDKALTVEIRELMCQSPIPSNPEHNRKVAYNPTPDTFISNQLASVTNNKPGYTGHVPGLRGTYSQTYGNATAAQIQKHTETHPRNNPQEAPGQAFTQVARAPIPLYSLKLVGETKTQSQPQKMVPISSQTHYFA